MREIQTDELKKIELNILKEFRDYCERKGLRYYLGGGTLLGAIRHKGFIPWDDDVDVVMPRPDYNKLLEFDSDSISDDIEIMTWRNGEAIFPFIKLIDKRTVVYERNIDEKKSTGVWVDVFPMEANPSDEHENKRFYRHIWFIRKMSEMSNARFGSGSSPIKKVGRVVLKPIASIIGTKKICEMINKYAQRYSFDESKYIGCVIWGYGEKERVHKEPFLSPIQVEFEGQYFNAPSSYDEYLSNIYGDYMTPPPEKERVTRHNMKAYWIE